MRLREHTATACLFILMICAVASPVAAQEFMQPPFVPPLPGTPCLLAGRFYFQAGAKYRSFESLRFSANSVPLTLTAATGTIPFGPTVAGNFGVGTGRDGFLGGAGTAWVYDNGFISGDVVPPGMAIGCAGPPAVPRCNPLDAVWQYFDPTIFPPAVNPELGRFVTSITGTGTCCDGLTVPFQVGSFQIVDPTVQTNNPDSISGTTTVTFQVVVPDSTLFVINTTPDAVRELGPTSWSPNFETGFQLYDYFDLFYGFSWFSVKNSMGMVNVLPSVPVSRTLIVDTFPFYSDDTSGWPGDNFYSSDTIINGNAAQNYHIAPNSSLRGIFPNRQFLTQTDFSVTADITEVINHKAEITVLESRFGGRTWIPLYGIGRLGATLGFAFMPAYYNLSGSRHYSSGATVFLAENFSFKDWRPHFGGFVGGDLELGYGSCFGSFSMDFMWATPQVYTLSTVQTDFNPGGTTIGFNLGVHF